MRRSSVIAEPHQIASTSPAASAPRTGPSAGTPTPARRRAPPRRARLRRARSRRARRRGSSRTAAARPCRRSRASAGPVRRSWQRPQVHLAVPLGDRGAEALPLVRLVLDERVVQRRRRATAHHARRPRAARARRRASAAAAERRRPGRRPPPPGRRSSPALRRPRVEAARQARAPSPPAPRRATGTGSPWRPAACTRAARWRTRIAQVRLSKPQLTAAGRELADVPVARVGVDRRSAAPRACPGACSRIPPIAWRAVSVTCSSRRPGSAKTFSSSRHRRQVVVAAVRHRADVRLRHEARHRPRTRGHLGAHLPVRDQPVAGGVTAVVLEVQLELSGVLVVALDHVQAHRLGVARSTRCTIGRIISSAPTW